MVSLLHDEPDDSTQCQGGILELFDPDASCLLVIARNLFNSYNYKQFLLCCEDPEVVRRNDVDRDRDVLGIVRPSDLARQGTRWRRRRHGCSLSVRDHQCEVFKQVCRKFLFGRLLLGLVVDDFH